MKPPPSLKPNDYLKVRFASLTKTKPVIATLLFNTHNPLESSQTTNEIPLFGKPKLLIILTEASIYF